VTISERLVAEIAAMIRDGRLRPGDRLPSEYELMKQFGVGRSSVREALKGLSFSGILETKPKRGTIVVSSLDSRLADTLAAAVAYWEIRDLYEIRILLEGEAAALAAVNGTPEDISQIQRCHAALVKAVSAGASHFYANSRFHVSIAKASHNGALLTCIGAIVGSYRSAREQINQLESVPKNDIADHQAILNSIRRRQPHRARQLMQTHLGETILRLEEPEIGLKKVPAGNSLRPNHRTVVRNRGKATGGRTRAPDPIDRIELTRWRGKGE
jgi:GntR family transcriptional repressor for pyruvate dehydrogenase complex